MRIPNNEQLQFIQKRLEIHRQKAAEIYGEENLVGVFVFGSWNLGSWYEHSDVDTIALINSVQNFEEILHLNDGTGEVSYHISIDRLLNWFIIGDEISVQTLEIMGTPYYWINTNFTSYFLKLKMLLPDLINSKKTQIYNSELSKMSRTIKQIKDFIFSPTNKQVYYAEQLYWKKLIYHTIQSEYFLNSWLFYSSWEKSVFYSQEELIKYKIEQYSFSEAYQNIISSRERIFEMRFKIKNGDPTYLHAELKKLRISFKNHPNIYQGEIKLEYYGY